jgi:hypothetical protein
VRRIRFATVLALALLLGASDAGASGIVPPHNPSSNLWAMPAYSFTSGANQTYAVGSPLPACWTWSSSGTFSPRADATVCVKAEVSSTERAQRVEGLDAFALPDNFAALTPAEQSLVLVDIERVSRGEPPVLGLSVRANLFAQRGAVANADPELPSDSGVAGATGGWAANYASAVSALDANYEWMYTDGWDGTRTFNYDCTSAGAPGCWGHRDNILMNGARLPCYESSCELVMGAGYVAGGAGNGYGSYTELLIQVAGAIPVLYYTWARALAAGARA